MSEGDPRRWGVINTFKGVVEIPLMLMYARFFPDGGDNLRGCRIKQLVHKYSYGKRSRWSKCKDTQPESEDSSRCQQRADPFRIFMYFLLNAAAPFDCPVRYRSKCAETSFR